MSPGSSEVDGTVAHPPDRNTLSWVARVDIPRSVCMFRWREKAVVASKIRIIPSVISVYFQYSSNSQSAAQKS